MAVDPGSEKGGHGSGEAGEANGPAEGRLDGVALLYIAGGIPAMVVFFLVLFAGAHACDIPA